MPLGLPGILVSFIEPDPHYVYTTLCGEHESTMLRAHVNYIAF